MHRNDADGTRTELRERRDSAARQLNVAEAGVSRLIDAYEAGVIEIAELNDRSARARARVAAATAALSDADAAMRCVVELTALTNTVETFAARLRDGIHAASWADRRKVIRALVKEVCMDGENVRIIYQIPGVPSAGDAAPTG